MKNLKKPLSFFLTILMIFSALPMTTLVSSAASGETSLSDAITSTAADPSTSDVSGRFSNKISEDGKLETDKTVTYASDEYGAFSSYADDEFAVDLSALGQAYSINNTTVTNTTTKIHPDVLFVVDVSGSMGRQYMVDDSGNTTSTLRIEGTVTALNAAVAELLESDPDTRWGVICYGTNYYGTNGIYLPIDNYTLPYGEDEYFTYGYQTTTNNTKTVATALKGELLMSTTVTGATTFMYPLAGYVSTEEDTTQLRLGITNGGVATLYMPGSTTGTASSPALTEDGDSYGIKIDVGAGSIIYGMLRSGDEFKLYKNAEFDYTTGSDNKTNITTTSGSKTELFTVDGHTYSAYRNGSYMYIYYDGSQVATATRNGSAVTYTDPVSGKELSFTYTRTGSSGSYVHKLSYTTLTKSTTCVATETKTVKTGTNSGSTAKRISTSGLLRNSSGTYMGVTSYTVDNDATYTAAGLDAAVDMFSKVTNTADRIPVVVLVTDGNPTVADTDVYRTSSNGADGSAETETSGSYDVNNVGTTGNGNIIGNGNTSQASNRLAGYTIKTALKVKEAVSNLYANSDALYMTIGPGIVSDFSKLFLDPSAENVENASKLDTEIQADDSKIAKASGLAAWLKNETNFPTDDYKKLTDLSDFTISGNFSVNSFVEAMQLLVAKITDNTRPITTSLTETDYKTGFVGDNDSYVIFTDTIGDGMELTSTPVLRYAEKNYTSTSSRTGTATYDGETVNYTAYYYKYDVTEESTGYSVDLSKLVCYVYTNSEGNQVVRWCIPAEDLPTIYPVYDSEGNCTYQSATPIRLIYKVAPDEETATELAKEAAATGASEKSFYTNSVEKPATVEFTPTLGNPYYYTLKASSDGSMSYGVDYDGTDKAKTSNNTDTLASYEQSSIGSDGRVSYTLGNNGEIVVKAFSIPVTKVWNDGNDADRAESITLQLYKNGVAEGDAVTITADDCDVSEDGNTWVYTFGFLGEKNASDVYTVKEVNADSKYTVTQDGTTVTNSLESKVVFTKVWDDNNASSRPSSVKLNLLKNGEVFDTVTLTAADNWTYTYTFYGVIGDDEYSAEEVDQADRYISEVSTETVADDHSATVTVTNSLSTEIPVTKIWNDNNCSTRPTSVQLELVKNGEPTGNVITVTGEGDTWTGSFKIKGEIGSDVYTVREVNPDNRYTVTYDGMTVTNTLQASVTFEKVWNDNNYANRPDSVTLELSKNGEVFDTVTVTAADDWKYVYTFIGEIGDDVYSAKEINVADNYEVTYGTESSGTNGKVVTVTNSMYTDFTVTKVWRDNSATTRPENVTIRLYKKNADGEYEKTDYVATFSGEGDTWEYTFRVVGSCSDGEYKIQEENVDSRYTAKYNSDGNAVTNTLRSKIECTKIWNDNGYTDRPDSVTLQLYKNGEKFGSSFTVKAEDCSVTTTDTGKTTWVYTYEFTGEILDTDKYELKEVYTDSRYQKTEEGLTVTNTMYSEIPVTKFWDDNGYSGRPEKIILDLYNAEGTKVDTKAVTTSNSTVTSYKNGDAKWVYTFLVIGSADGYYIKESDANDLSEYTVTYSADGRTVTNTLIPDQEGQPAITKTADGTNLTETGTAIVTLTAEANNDFTAKDATTTDVMGEAYNLQLKNTVYNGKSVSPYISVRSYPLCQGNDITDTTTTADANAAWTQFGASTTKTTYTAKTIYVRQDLSATAGTYLLGSDSYIFYFTGGTEEANDLGYGITVNSSAKTYYTDSNGSATASYSNYIEGTDALSSKLMVVKTSGSGITIQPSANTSYYLVHNTSSPYVRFNTNSSVYSISNNRLYWTTGNRNKTYHYVTLTSGGGAQTTTASSATTLYFYKPVTVYEKSESTVDTTEYYGISGATALTLPTTQAASLTSYIKSNTNILHKDTSGNVTTYGWQSDITLDTSAVNASVPGTYTATISYNGTKIGEVKVTVVYGGEENTPYTDGIDSLIEKITFNADGTEAYSTAVDNGSTNILTDGKINGKYVIYDLDSETFTWTHGELTGTQQELEYMVYLTDSLEGKRAAGSYDTNEYALLKFTDKDGEQRTVEYPVPTLQWCSFPEKTFVADYGLGIAYNVLDDFSDLAGAEFKILGVVSGDNYTNLNTTKEPSLTASCDETVKGSFGTFTVDKDGNTLYNLNTMNFTKEDVFYVGVHVTKLNGKDVDLYGYEKLTYVPATTIYYEDDFGTVTYKDGVDAKNTGKGYGTWSTVTDTSISATTLQDTDIVGDASANVYGYDSHYDNFATYSNASAKKVQVSNVNSTSKKTAGAEGGKWPSFSFQFTGTGFDLIALTSSDTGYFVITVTNSAGTVVKRKTVDTYYGYKYGRLYIVDDKTADNYGEVTLTPTNTPLYETEDTTDDAQALGDTVTAGGHTYSTKPSYNSKGGLTGTVMYLSTSVNNGVIGYTSTPTYYGDDGLIYEGKPYDDEVYAYAYAYAYGWLMDESVDTSLYQIPVMKLLGLDYDTYDVTIEARYTAANDHCRTDESGNKYYDLYVDSLRIYDPAGTSANDYSGMSTVVSEAYKTDGEAYQKYMTIKNMIIGSDTINADSTLNEGYMFIDGMQTVTKQFMAEYRDKGPNNELYLGSNQAVAFEILATDEPEDIQIGLKHSSGTIPTSVKFIYGGKTYYVKESANGVSTATDMYYSLYDIIGKDNITWTAMKGEDGKTVYTTGAIVIQNSSTSDDSILSVTNIKWTFNSENEGLYNNGTYTINMSEESKDEAINLLAMANADLYISSVDKSVSASDDSDKIQLTVTTSSDVQELIVRDDEGNVISSDDLTTFSEQLENGDLQWTVIIAEEQSGVYTFSIQTVFDGYTPTDPITVTVTVGDPVLTPAEETTTTEPTTSEETTEATTEETTSTEETTTSSTESTTSSDVTTTTSAEETTTESSEETSNVITSITDFFNKVYTKIVDFFRSILSFLGINF